MNRTGRDRERFDGIRADHGEDPARWLDQPLLEPTSEGSDPALAIRARIRGIDDKALLSAWKAVERQLGRDDGEPRSKVIRWLERREESLQARGDLAERLSHLDDRPEQDPETTVVRYDADGEPYRLEAGSFGGDSRRYLDADPLAEDGGSAVATDGGESA